MRRLLLALLSVLVAATVAATRSLPHDTWLLAMGTPGSGERGIQLSLRTGMDFPVSTTAVSTDRFEAVLRSPDGTVRAVEEWQVDDAGKATGVVLGALAPGLHVAGLTVRPRLIQLDAQSFNSYLLSDGMPQVLAGRIARDELYEDAVERYRKCPKVMFAVGEVQGEGWSEPLGLALEIVPLEHPLRSAPRETLPVRVLFEGEPLERALVCWDRPGNGHDFTGTTWTDARGEALVPIHGPGWMTVRLTHMTRPKNEDYEWESFWASLSFEVDG